MSQLIWAVCNRPVGFGMDLGCHWRLGRLYGPRIVLSIVRHGDVLPGECFWAPPRRNIMKPQGVLHFSVPVGEDAERRQGGGTFPDYFRVSGGASWKTRVIVRFPKKLKPWNKAKNDHTRLSSEVRMIAIVMIFMLMPL